MPVKFEFDWFRLLILFEIYLGEEFQNEWGLWFFFQLKRTLIFCCSIPNCFLYCFDLQLLFLTILYDLYPVYSNFSLLQSFSSERNSGFENQAECCFSSFWSSEIAIPSCRGGKFLPTSCCCSSFIYTDYFPFHSYLILMVLLFFTSTTSFSPWRYSTMWWLRALSLVTLLIVS